MMKSLIPWVCLVTAGHSSLIAASNGVEAYREGHYAKAAQYFNSSSKRDPVVDYYMGRMRLYGYGELKNNLLAMRHLRQAAEKGYLPAQRIVARVALFEDNNPEQALYWFKKSSDLDDTDAHMYCAAAYLFGVGTKKNPDVARRYYIAAAKNGNPVAQYAIANYFLKTKHASNRKLGLIWLNKSVEQKNPVAQLMLAQLYMEGKLVEKNNEQAKALIEAALAQGYMPAMYEMGEWAQEQGDLELAKQWYIKAANALYRPAELALGHLYLEEKSPLYDPKVGFLWMLRAAQNGSHQAALTLSDLYQKGIGVTASQNLADEWKNKAKEKKARSKMTAQMKAAQWLSNRHVVRLSETSYKLQGILSPWKNKAALKENIYNQAPQMNSLTRQQLYKPSFTMISPNTLPIGEYYNALLASLGALPEQKLMFPLYSLPEKNRQASEKDIKSLENRASLGDFTAQLELGIRYHHGDGVKKNIEEAIKYYQLAALQQDLRAQYMLAVLYLKGEDAGSNYAKGIELIEDAAFKGNPDAQYVLAQVEEQGFHDPSGAVISKKDYSKAVSMYQVAASNDYGLAQYRLAELFAREKPEDLSAPAIAKRQMLIKKLYQGAVDAHIQAAQLPLAFFNASDSNPEKQKTAFQVAKKEADSGNTLAALLLGLMYDRGITVPIDHDEALAWYRKAQPNPIAHFILGTYVSQTDPEQGQSLLQQSADAGFSYAHHNLGVLLQQKGMDFLPQLQKSLALGNSKAGLLMADYYLTQANNDQQMKQAYDIYQSVAEKGDKEAQVKLGFMLEKGLGVALDESKALIWYERSAEQGYPMAQYLLGHLYQLGFHTSDPDYALAKKWYRLAQVNYSPASVALGFIADTVDDDYQQALTQYQKAANLGNPVALYDAGLVYEKGKGHAVDQSKAAELYLAAANKGHGKAMVQLAGLYFSGAQGDRNEAKALEWYTKAAKLGDRDALYQLGLMSETGVAVPVNYSKAVEYYRFSSEKGDTKAKLALARMYRYGIGTTKDIPQSIALYQSLSEQGNAYAQYQLAKLYLDGLAGERYVSQGKSLLQQAEKNGSLEAKKVLQWLISQQESRVSFIEPADIAHIAVSMTMQSPDLMYWDALNAWNRGDESDTRMILSRILLEYPDYLPAKNTYEQLRRA